MLNGKQWNFKLYLHPDTQREEHIAVEASFNISL